MASPELKPGKSPEPSEKRTARLLQTAKEALKHAHEALQRSKILLEQSRVAIEANRKSLPGRSRS